MKTTTTVLVLLLALAARAETFEMRKRIVCDTREEIFTKLAEEYHERPLWLGHSPVQTTDLVLTVNEELGTWTLVEYGDSWACVLAVGERSRLMNKDKTI